jgi:sodium/bile acid cotransporter 7
VNLKKNFLPFGLVLSLTVSLLLPGPGQFFRSMGATPWLITLIFLVNGFQTKMDEIRFGRKLLFALIAGILLNLVLAPFLGLAVAKIFSLSSGIALGIIVMSAMPPTISSGIVVSEAAGGNRFWALSLTLALNLIGVFTVPFVLLATVAAEEGVRIESIPLLMKLLKQVLLPFIVGFVVKRLIERGGGKTSIPFLSYLPPTCIVLLTWGEMSTSRSDLLSTSAKDFVAAGIAAMIVHLAVMLLCLALRKPLHIGDAEGKSMMFVVSQKTLPIAITVLAALNMPAGPALVACILFHFLQLMIDSVVAAKAR